ncbi:MAG: DUF503 domain-containing protein [Candidatus Aureabacteria bacterium]|nr:DUF503 domain-containing protein [Candidatus Auribacterota bacterium]NLW93477.1 DUF503 domain-containing protein [Chlamydiota bacterium]HOE27881.1 DUF503 domain-containing protein [bacterium]HQM52804.1 DUF503 domain-containing protein [bacterium]
MVIGVLEMQLSMPGNRSLKDKRQVLKSVKDRVRAAFNVSIAEVAEQERWCAAHLAAATVAPDRERAHAVLEAVARMVERRGDAVLAGYCIQML